MKLFIIQRLACFYTPTAVALAVKEEFQIDIDRSHVGCYDPTTHKGRELGKKLKEIFIATRKDFLQEKTTIPIGNKAFRLNALQDMYERALARKNDIQAMRILEQAAKETGDLYTNKVNVSGNNENSLVDFLMRINGTSIPIVHDINQEDYVDVIDVSEAAKIKDNSDLQVSKPRLLVGRD